MCPRLTARAAAATMGCAVAHGVGRPPPRGKRPPVTAAVRRATVTAQLVQSHAPAALPSPGTHTHTPSPTSPPRRHTTLNEA